MNSQTQVIDHPGFQPVIISYVGHDGKATRTVCNLTRPEPEFYGLLLADAIHHIADAMAKAGLIEGGKPLNRVEITTKIARVIRREMEKPTAKHREERPDEKGLLA